MSGVKNIVQADTKGLHVPTNEDLREEGTGGPAETAETEK